MRETKSTTRVKEGAKPLSVGSSTRHFASTPKSVYMHPGNRTKSAGSRMELCEERRSFHCTHNAFQGARKCRFSESESARHGINAKKSMRRKDMEGDVEAPLSCRTANGATRGELSIREKKVCRKRHRRRVKRAHATKQSENRGGRQADRGKEEE